MPINATITGRLARDPELKTTQKGTTLVSCTIPVDTGWGESKSTTWWRVTLFGKRAEVVAQHLSKGKWAMFSGPVSVREYTKKDGSTGTSAEMTANDFHFVGNKSDGNGGGSRSGGQSGGGYGNRGGSQSTGRPQSSQSGSGAGFADDSIPF